MDSPPWYFLQGVPAKNDAEKMVYKSSKGGDKATPPFHNVLVNY